MANNDAVYHFQRIRFIYFWIFFLNIFIDTCVPQKTTGISSTGLPTVTVRGFLNFKTTVDGTVIVFTPASEVPPPTTEPKPHHTTLDTFKSSTVESNAFLETDELNSQEGMHGEVPDIIYASPPQNSLETIKTLVTEMNILDNKIKDPFLQHISDNAVLPSAGQVNNDVDKIRKLQSSQNQYPTGLVTVLGGTFVDGLSTTVYETKVIGTYIDGKYAQILQSTSHVVSPTPTSYVTTPILTYSTVELMLQDQKSDFSNSILRDELISSSESSERVVLKSFIPSTSVGESSLQLSQFTPMISSSSTTTTISSSSTAKTISSSSTTKTISSSSTTTTISSSSRATETIASQLLENVPSQKMNVIDRTNNQDETTANIDLKQREIKPSSVLQSSFVITNIKNTLNGDLPTETLESAKKSIHVRKFSPVVPISSTIVRLSDDENTVMLKERNNNTSRTRFLSPRRPSQTVRLNRFKVKLTLRQDSPDEYNVTLPTDDEDLEDHTHKGEDDIEIVTDGIGIVVDPARVVFQETTITSEVTIHVGRRKSVRTLTITTSIPLTVHPTDIQDILSSQSTAMDASDTDQQIVTRTFTTTERALKTSVVPIFDGKSTMYHTVTESFFIMKIITAYRTLPPGDPSAIESFLDEPEISATTLEVAANIPSSAIQTPPTEQLPAEDVIRSTTALPMPGNSQTQLTNPLLSLGHALSNNPLAAVYLGLQQLNAQMTLYSTITDTSTYVTTQTIYSTKTIRFYDGRSTKFREISDPISTKKSTITTTITSVQPYLNTHAMQQQQQLQKLIAPTQLTPHYNTITSSYTTVTTATSLSKRIYTLIYNGFSTKFRTVTSTTLYPTTVTVTTTSIIPVAPSHVNLPFGYPYSALAS